MLPYYTACLRYSVLRTKHIFNSSVLLHPGDTISISGSLSNIDTISISGSLSSIDTISISGSLQPYDTIRNNGSRAFKDTRILNYLLPNWDTIDLSDLIIISPFANKRRNFRLNIMCMPKMRNCKRYWRLLPKLIPIHFSLKMA